MHIDEAVHKFGVGDITGEEVIAHAVKNGNDGSDVACLGFVLLDAVDDEMLKALLEAPIAERVRKVMA